MKIRALEQGDLEWVRRQRNRPECKMWFRQSEYLTEKQQQNWFDNNDMITFAVIDEEDDIIGVVALSHIDRVARKCEFSIMIMPEMRNRGYGKKALWELLNHAFFDLNMKQVFSEVFSTNPALQSYLKWGFRQYGTLYNWYYKDGKYIDSVVISILKDEYNHSVEQTVSE